MKKHKWSEEVKKKMSESAKKAWANPEIRKKRIERHFRGKQPSGKRIITKCSGCGKEMEILPYLGERNHYKRYCSKECQKNRVEKKCDICGKIIIRSAFQVKNCKGSKFYCSVECRGIGRRKRLNIICEACGKEFSGLTFKGKTPRFCSKKCSNKGKITGSFVHCKRCGKRFWEFKSRLRTYCSEKCAQISSRSDFFDKKEVMRKNFGKIWSQKVKKRDNYICQKCGSKEQIAAHHIKPFGDYPNERFNIDNGITLCRECHLKVHSGELTI